MQQAGFIGKAENLYKTHRVCSEHFYPRMFLKGKRQLLRKDAIPISYTEKSQDLVSPEPSTSGLSAISYNDNYPDRYDGQILPSLLDPDPKISEPVLIPANVASSAQTPQHIFVETSTAVPILRLQSSSLTSPTCYVQTSELLTTHTPRKEKLRRINLDLQLENKKVKKENQELRKKCEVLEKRLKDMNEEAFKEITIEYYKSLTYKLCPKVLADFINVQVSQIQKSPKGRRYSEEFKYKCLSIYFSGPKVYKTILMKMFCLPGPQTLHQLLRGIDIPPGLEVPNVFRALQLKAENLNLHNRFCVLCVDEISIKANLFYHRGSDLVVGVEPKRPQS